MSTEQLEALARQADMIDGEAAAATPAAMAEAQEQADAVSLAQANANTICMVLEMAIPLVGKLYPSIPGAVGEDERMQLAGAWGVVLAKHGINIKDLGGKYKEEIAAGMATFMVGTGVYEAIKTDVLARAKKKPIEAQAKTVERVQQDKSAQAAEPDKPERVLPTETPSELAGA